MGVRSPHEATAEASRPNNLHSRNVQGRAMLPTKSISDENRARAIGTLNWRADVCDRRPLLCCVAGRHRIRRPHKRKAPINPRAIGKNAAHGAAGCRPTTTAAARRHRLPILIAAAMLLRDAVRSGAQTPGVQSFEARITLGDVPGRIDHMAIDPGRNRLFVCGTRQ
jgi:hypothetical protein